MHKSFTKESGDATIHRLPAYIIQYANRSSRGGGGGGGGGGRMASIYSITITIYMSPYI